MRLMRVEPSLNVWTSSIRVKGRALRKTQGRRRGLSFSMTSFWSSSGPRTRKRKGSYMLRIQGQLTLNKKL